MNGGPHSEPLSWNETQRYAKETFSEISKYSVREALKKAGIQDFRPHDLRHTYVSNARKAGIDQTVIMKLTGRKTLSMFTRYNTVDQADAREAMQRLDKYFSMKDEPTAAIVLQE